MATANADYTVPAEPTLKGVTLELTPDEAQYLLDLTGTVAGAGRFRALNDAIADALRRGANLKYSVLENKDNFPFEGEWNATLEVKE